MLVGNLTLGNVTRALSPEHVYIVTPNNGLDVCEMVHEIGQEQLNLVCNQ